MGYSIYLDSTQDFKCKIKLEGSALSKAKPRLVVNAPSLGFSLIFEGHILPNTGQCIIPIPKLRSVLDEGDKGTLQLEIIAEGDTYFQAWTDEFSASYKKKVTVSEVDSKTSTQIVESKKPTVIVEFEKDANIEVLVMELYDGLRNAGVSIDNISKKAAVVKNLVNELQIEHELSENDVNSIIDKTIKLL